MTQSDSPQPKLIARLGAAWQRSRVRAFFTWPRVRNGLGIAILSTSRGLMSDRDARQARTGGELLALVW